jgi:polyphosphate:AMP phosphotransferase
MRNMFEPAETGAKLTDAAFQHTKSVLRLALVELQQRNRLPPKFPIIVLISGVRGAGVADTLNLLNTWMDPRWIHAHAVEPPTDEERNHPPFWRYWRSLPASGTTGVYLGGWYAQPIAEHSAGKIADAAFTARMREIVQFENTLAGEGALIVKIWLHLSKAAEAKAQITHRADSAFGFRSGDDVIPQPADYGKYIRTAGLGIAATQGDKTPWHIIDGSDDNFRRAGVLTILRDRLEAQFKLWDRDSKAAAKSIKQARKETAKALKTKAAPKKAARLARADLTKTMSDTAYTRAFATLQSRLYDAQKEARALGISTVVAFEGWDAAGKGGAIRRLTYCLNARNYQVEPISAPNDEERAHHFLWRFWRALQPSGRFTIFDRTWYGRVLVERVDNLIPEAAWQRAYEEINAFEKQLTTHDNVVLKFWLHIDRKTQKKRFEEREQTPYKTWKISADDWHNRKRWHLYEAAIEDMLAKTSCDGARWHVVPAKDKRYARILILKTIAAALDKAIAARKKRK